MGEVAEVVIVISCSVVVGVVAVVAVHYLVRCSYQECCSEKWISPQFTELACTFNSKLHGQHLVPEKVIRSIRGHFNDQNPSKALVLSFHGWTGSGKNFVSRIIEENMFVKGGDSQYVRLIVPSEHFPHKTPDKLRQYKDWLRNEISSRVKLCARSLFILDEIEEMPNGLLDAIKPYLDFHRHVDGVDYRKSIFIFLSNDGGNEITKAVLAHEAKGTKREDLKLADMQEAIIQSAFKEKGGLKHSSLIEKNLISAFLPFLPMEKKHVVLCIKDEINKKGYRYSEKIVQNIIDELPWNPSSTRRYSSTGCKWVADKVKQFYG